MDETTQLICCTDCNITFTSKRALVKHSKTAEAHAQKKFPCLECGKLFTNTGSVTRHVKGMKCPKNPLSTSSPSLHLAVKHMIEDDVEDRSPKRCRGKGPVEADHPNLKERFAEEIGPRLAALNTSAATASTNKALQRLNDDLIPMHHYPLLADNPSYLHGDMATGMDRSSKTTSAEASSMDRTESPWDSAHESVLTQLTFNEESIVQIPETTNVKPSITLITSPHTTLATPTVVERQDPVDATYLSDAMRHASIDVDIMPTSCEAAKLELDISTNKRSRFSVTESTISRQSKRSITSLGSIGSLFLNRSIRNSMSSSALSFKSVGWRSFHSFDMAAPMLEDIDEELGRSRTQDHFWKRHDPRRLRQRMLQHEFWKQIRNNDMAGVTRSLASGEVDVNRANDQGWTPLCVAASQGYVEIVVRLLACDSIDLEFHDNCGTTALTWAATVGQLEIVKQLLDSGKVETYLKDGVGCAALTFASRNKHTEIADLILAKLDQ